MFFNPDMNTIPESNRTNSAKYTGLVNEFVNSGLDIGGVTLSVDEKPNTVKRGLTSAIKALGAKAACIVRNGTVFLITPDKAVELGFIPNAPVKPRKKKGDKQPAPTVDSL